MKKFSVIVSGVALLASSMSAFAAGDKAKIAARLQDAGTVISQIMSAPDKGIPGEILAGASCVVVIPSFKGCVYSWCPVWPRRCDLPHAEGLECAGIGAVGRRERWISDWWTGN